MGIGIGSVKPIHFKAGAMNPEVALVRELYAEQIGIACVFGLREAGIYVTLVFVVVTDLIYNEIVDLLVEDTGADQTDAAEIIVGAQVEVIRHGGLQFRVTDGDFIVGAFDVYAWYKAEYLGRDSVWVNEPRTLKSSFTFHFMSKDGRKLM